MKPRVSTAELFWWAGMGLYRQAGDSEELLCLAPRGPLVPLGTV